MNKFFLLLTSCFILNTSTGYCMEQEMDNPSVRQIELEIQNLDFEESQYKKAVLKLNIEGKFHDSFEDQLNRCKKIITDLLLQETIKQETTSTSLSLGEISNDKRLEICKKIITNLLKRYNDKAACCDSFMLSFLRHLPTGMYCYRQANHSQGNSIYSLNHVYSPRNAYLQITTLKSLYYLLLPDNLKQPPQRIFPLDVQSLQTELDPLIVNLTEEFIRMKQETFSIEPIHLKTSHNPIDIYRNYVLKREKFYHTVQKLLEESLIRLEELSNSHSSSLKNDLDLFMGNLSKQLNEQLNEQLEDEILSWADPVQLYEEKTLTREQCYLKTRLHDLDNPETIYIKSPYHDQVKLFFIDCEKIIIDLSDFYLCIKDDENHLTVKNLFDKILIDFHRLKRDSLSKVNKNSIQESLKKIDDLMETILNNELLKQIKTPFKVPCIYIPLEIEHHPHRIYKKIRDRLLRMLDRIEKEEDKGGNIDYFKNFLTNIGEKLYGYYYSRHKIGKLISLYNGPSTHFTIEIPKIGKTTPVQSISLSGLSSVDYKISSLFLSLETQEGRKQEWTVYLSLAKLSNNDLQKIMIELRKKPDSSEKKPGRFYAGIDYNISLFPNNEKEEDNVIIEKEANWHSFWTYGFCGW